MQKSAFEQENFQMLEKSLKIYQFKFRSKFTTVIFLTLLEMMIAIVIFTADWF